MKQPFDLICKEKLEEQSEIKVSESPTTKPGDEAVENTDYPTDSRITWINDLTPSLELTTTKTAH